MAIDSRLIFHCNADDISGLGHFMRCFELAKAIEFFYPQQKILFCGHVNDYAQKLIVKAKLTFIALSADEAFSLAVLNKINYLQGDLLLIDSYIASQNFYNNLSQQGVAWGVFDDFATQDFSQAKLVINFRIDAENLFEYDAEVQALGISYMPINSKFEKLRSAYSQKEISKSIKKVVICLGSTDLYSASAPLAKIISEALDCAKIIVITNGVINSNELAGNIKVLPLQENIEDFLTDVDLVISGGGRLKYESAFCGIPNAALSQTDGQYEDSVLLDKACLSLDLGRAGKINRSFIVSQVTQFDQKKRLVMQQQQLKIFKQGSTKNLVDLVRQSLLTIN